MMININNQTNLKLENCDVALNLNLRGLIAPKRTYRMEGLFWKILNPYIIQPQKTH